MRYRDSKVHSVRELSFTKFKAYSPLNRCISNPGLIHSWSFILTSKFLKICTQSTCFCFSLAWQHFINKQQGMNQNECDDNCTWVQTWIQEMWLKLSSCWCAVLRFLLTVCPLLMYVAQMGASLIKSEVAPKFRTSIGSFTLVVRSLTFSTFEQ